MLMNKITSIITLNISGVTTDLYNYTISQNQNLTNQIDIKFNFKTEIVMGDILTIDINYVDSLKDEFILKNKEIAVAMNLYCIPPTIYLISKNNLYA